jgi:hypothetical protein
MFGSNNGNPEGALAVSFSAQIFNSFTTKLNVTCSSCMLMRLADRSSSSCSRGTAVPAF